MRFSSHIFESGGTLNSGYGKMSRFAAVIIFLSAVSAAVMRTDLTAHDDNDFPTLYKCICTCSAPLKQGVGFFAFHMSIYSSSHSVLQPSHGGMQGVLMATVCTIKN